MFLSKSRLYSQRLILIVLLTIVLLFPFNQAASFLNNPNDRFIFACGTEFGFVKVLSQKIQFSQDGTRLDYVKEGKQDILNQFWL